MRVFWSLKSARRKKFLYVSSLSEFFSLVRKERKGQKEECFPLLNTFCRLAATRANTLPRPSDYSIAAATGSKRLSADSDSLLCHVRLWRTSRFRFGCASVCKHSEIKVILIAPSAHILNPRPPCIYCGRADNACTNLLGYFVHFVRTRGIAEISESGKTTDFRSVLCRTHLPRTARATNSCTPHGGFQGGRRESSLMTFAALLGIQKRKKKSFFAGDQWSTPVSATPTHMLRICVNSPTIPKPEFHQQPK